ncbi:lysine exporter LysO family protein [Pasteurella canis]|uniref:Membrane protein n=1 Tax=Pasteurella canis TaxID=753 RepID=A0A379EUD1_9PAST|nr:lysine exporter LysO family protein [Pasteurella canis]MXN87564.1 LysO family transporter [Pasteurella canis]UAY78212.1 lysine exporter LysO family protein [Pasteurella canis]UDW84287.1 lysine exporter LysO family protein [Pasteurella canis]UEA17295.1 lysine exporter LysO family protein [Pasteurella canis]UEC23732.1 lysine exporter LysO family protein [Pasteurella canis]
MYEGLLIVLCPLFIGYLIKTNNTIILKSINTILMILLYIILFIMGFSLGQLDNLAQKLPIIAVSAATFAFIIQSLNLIGLITFDRFFPKPLKICKQEMPSRWKLLLDSSKLCSMVLFGFIVGYYTKTITTLPKNASTYVLVCLIFSVGIQLRNNGISLREVLFNKRGLITGMIFIITSLVGGIVSAIILHLPITQGLAIASGFGWYSLSSVIINDAWGPIFGSIAFFNDLSREITSLFVIPFLMHNHRSSAVGISGATALDCTLPIIQKSGGIEVVPLAISFGFITNILPPILLVFFSSFPI